MRIPLAALLLLLIVPAGHSVAEPVTEEHAFLTVALGRGPTRLETIVVKQERQGRLPVAPKSGRRQLFRCHEDFAAVSSH